MSSCAVPVATERSFSNTSERGGRRALPPRNARPACATHCRFGHRHAWVNIDGMLRGCLIGPFVGDVDERAKQQPQ